MVLKIFLFLAIIECPFNVRVCYFKRYICMGSLVFLDWGPYGITFISLIVHDLRDISKKWPICNKNFNENETDTKQFL